MEEEEEGLDEEEIDKLKLPKAIKVAKEKKIDISQYKKLEDIKCALKRHLLHDKRKRDDVVKNLTISADEDAGKRCELQETYDALIQTVKELEQKNEPMLEQLHHSFPDFFQMLVKERDKLAAKTVRCPIMVLGETGAGKSSFINLILGCDLLPYSLLSNTNTICEIQHGSSHRVILHPQERHLPKEERDCESFEELRDILREKIQKNEDQTSQTQCNHTEKGNQTSQTLYKRAEIFLPNDILMTGLMIVDSPGIADTKEMTDLVLDYLIDACAFIYIINSANAGGVAPERLQELLHKVIEKAFRDQQDFRPECALFVCNKWDQVQLNERKAVKEDTIRKLTGSSTGWPGCKESQIFTLSTQEASFIQKSPEKFVVGQFASLLKDIIKLVPKSREILLSNSVRLLKQVVDKSLFIIDHKLSDAELTEENKERRNVQTLGSLADLKQEVCQFFEKEKLLLRKKLDVITEKLSKHLRQEDVAKRICSVTASDVPEDKPWKEVTVIVRSVLYDKMAEEIRKWEAAQHEFEKLGKETADQFLRKFPDFDMKLHNAEQRFLGSARGDHSVALSTPQVPFVPMNITQKFDNLNLGFKVLIGVTFAPVFLIGAIVRLPVWGIKELKRKIDSVMLEKDYGTDRLKALEKYADITLQATTDAYKMKPVIEEEIQPLLQYLENQRQKVITLIDADIAIIDQQKKEMRRRESILTTYCDLKRKFEDHQRGVLFFYKMRMPVPKHFIDVDEIHFNDKVSEGATQILCHGVMKTDAIPSLEKMAEVVVRKSRLGITRENIMSYLREEETYRFVHHLPCASFIRWEEKIWQVLVPFNCTLRELLQREVITTESKRKTYYSYMDQIVSGLEFLHRKGLVHIDLSLDTIVVDSEKKIRLVNVNSPCTLPSNLFPHDSTDIQSYTHFHPNVLSDPDSNTYKPKHDMYSVGIVMWEMWTNQRAFKVEIDQSKKIRTLGDFAKFVSDDHNRLELGLEDGKGIVDVNVWDECIVKCQRGELSACDWRDKMTNNKYDYRFAQTPVVKKH